MSPFGQRRFSYKPTFHKPFKVQTRTQEIIDYRRCGEYDPCRTLCVTEIQGYHRERSTIRSHCPMGCLRRCIYFCELVLKWLGKFTVQIKKDNLRGLLCENRGGKGVLVEGANRTPDSVSITAVIMPLPSPLARLLTIYIVVGLGTSHFL